MKSLIFLVFVILLNGCGETHTRKEKSEGDRTFEKGFELSDQGRFDEAIAYFKGLYDQKPTDDALKAWASVYIARAGITVSSLYEAVQDLPQDQVTKDNVWAQLMAYQKGLDRIPNVKGDRRGDLQTASSLLKSRPTASVRLLRGVVDLILLRSTFSDGERILKSAPRLQLEKDVKSICKLDRKFMRSWVLTWSYYGLELKQDLMVAYPSRQKDWKKGETFFKQMKDVSKQLVMVCAE